MSSNQPILKGLPLINLVQVKESEVSHIIKDSYVDPEDFLFKPKANYWSENTGDEVQVVFAISVSEYSKCFSLYHNDCYNNLILFPIELIEEVYQLIQYLKTRELITC